MAKTVDSCEPKKLSHIGIDLVGSLDPPSIVCVLVFETADGDYRFEVNQESARIISAAMQRYFDVVGPKRPTH